MKTNLALVREEEIVEKEMPKQAYQHDGDRLVTNQYIYGAIKAFMFDREYVGGANHYCEGYESKGGELIRWARRANKTKRIRQVIAKKINGFYVGNSSRLTTGQVLAVQIQCAVHMPMIPFEVVEQAGLNIEDLKVIEYGGQETFRVKSRSFRNLDEIVDRHFAGSCLFHVGDKCFLFDVDRQEIQNNIFNPFLSELPKTKKVWSIEEAYDLLKPDKVKIAELNGLEVKRQGEWFFIPKFPIIGKISSATPEGALQNGVNNSHTVKYWDEEHGLVTGKVAHRWSWEHRPLQLEKFWYEPVCNTAFQSFRVDGNVD